MLEGNKRCASWDFATQSWVTGGCETVQIGDSFVYQCTHLTNFAVLIVSFNYTVFSLISKGFCLLRMFARELRIVQQLRRQILCSQPSHILVLCYHALGLYSQLPL